MAFDFKGGGSSGSGAPFPPSSPGGGFRDKPGGFESKPAADQYAEPSGRSSVGFQNRPGRSMPRPDPVGRTTPPSGPRSRPAAPARHPPVRGRAPGPAFSFPWGRLFPVLLVLALLMVCFVFRAEIKAFLIELLTWAIILLIVILIFKHLLFGGKR